MIHRDLIRANIMKSSKIVILSPRVEEIAYATFDEDNNQTVGNDDE